MSFLFVPEESLPRIRSSISFLSACLTMNYNMLKMSLLQKFSYSFIFMLQNERPPLPASCQPALAHLIKRCWAPNPSKRPDFSDIVSALEKYDECVKEGLPLTHHSRLVSRNAILERLKGCVSLSSSIPVHA